MRVRVFLVAAVVAVVIPLVQPAHAAGRLQPVNEGGDKQHCVTFGEFVTLHVGMPVRRVQRVLDTNGHRVNRRTLDAFAAGLHHAVHGQIARGQVVRQYPTCTNDPQTAGKAFVEFGHKRGKLRVTLTYLTGTA